MKSMTGYGRGEASEGGYKVTVEIGSVNRKQSEATVYLPRELECLEAQVRDLINKRIARGRVNVKVGLHHGNGSAGGGIRLNVPLAKAYAREIAELARALNLKETVSLDAILKAPGVLEGEEKLEDGAAFWPAVEKAVGEALSACVKMREREGANLATDLKKRMAAMQKLATTVRKRAPVMVKEYRKALLKRVEEAGLKGPDFDEDRLMKEVVYFADRSDITEELTRLESHFGQFEDCAKSREPVGRTLDFLAQEMNREINTIGSKASDAVISKQVVQLKAELEKFREQVQNVE